MGPGIYKENFIPPSKNPLGGPLLVILGQVKVPLVTKKRRKGTKDTASSVFILQNLFFIIETYQAVVWLLKEPRNCEDSCIVNLVEYSDQSVSVFRSTLQWIENKGVSGLLNWIKTKSRLQTDVILHPFDLIKTKSQSNQLKLYRNQNPNPNPKLFPVSKSIWFETKFVSKDSVIQNHPK